MSLPLYIHSFPPISSEAAEIVILGTMPGKASLAAGQYYAHPRNLFWKFMAHIVGFHPEAAYAERLLALQTARIALWDVVQCCTRESSLDSDIASASVVPNDFATFFANHRHIQRIYFNGTKAHALYQKHVAAKIGAMRPHLVYVQLPSTSPANAAMPYSRKYAAWSEVNTCYTRPVA
ncbi:MAG: DNA-deoxyinosine glycosylase [Candidatus Viridilinea halotolerans]|uniref:DNA-deoxyinosine glycosylase n=1 Tax=Candidatus Viridilinea halotolerans TaxID=2491704 RepID=A0A426TRQ0_9CHLR|nr:MAG: DNA-deoxyinosine glycosylase [Candidatus Viridilinea halotolerans]